MNLLIHLFIFKANCRVFYKNVIIISKMHYTKQSLCFIRLHLQIWNFRGLRMLCHAIRYRWQYLLLSFTFARNRYLSTIFHKTFWDKHVFLSISAARRGIIKKFNSRTLNQCWNIFLIDFSFCPNSFVEDCLRFRFCDFCDLWSILVSFAYWIVHQTNSTMSRVLHKL